MSDPEITDVIPSRRIYDLRCSDLLAQLDQALHAIEAAPHDARLVAAKVDEAHLALHQACERLVDNELAYPLEVGAT